MLVALVSYTPSLKILEMLLTHKHAENTLYLKTAQEHRTVTSIFPTNLMFLNMGEKNIK